MRQQSENKSFREPKAHWAGFKKPCSEPPKISKIVKKSGKIVVKKGQK